MGALTVLLKDLREHSLAFLCLAGGLIAVILLSLAQQRAGEFTLSSFEVVRFALITVIPLIVLITGNRLIVREYTGGTRKFVESLPLRPFVPLLVKYLLGLVYLVLLGAVLIVIAAALAGPTEFVDQSYLLLLLLKTATVICLYWSIAFFISFTGKLRLVLYLVLGLAALYLINLPSFDETRFAPMALMDRQLFVFEREVIPWGDIGGTLILSIIFVAASFALALINEGSVAEQLGKPLSRRDIAAITVLGFGVIGLYTNLQRTEDSVLQDFSGNSVLRSQSPDIEIAYLSDAYQRQAQIALDNLSDMLTLFQNDTGLPPLPPLQVALNTDLERFDVYPEYTDGVLVTANFSDYNHYEHTMMSTIALHHMLLMMSNGRWDYEPMHWLLDGLSRWWAEGGAEAGLSVNNPEHFAKAIIATQRFSEGLHPLLPWQRLMDVYGFEAAGALAYTALLYLAESKGSQTVIDLAVHYINNRPGSSSIESIERFLNPDTERFEQVTGLSFDAFVKDWLVWLAEKETLPAIRDLVDAVPRVDGNVQSVVDKSGVYWLEASYTARADYRETFSGHCVLRHQRTSAFDIETEIYDRDRDRSDCPTDGIAHRVQSPYASGDRAYVVLEFESDYFNRPIPLWTGRVHIK